MLWTRGLPSYGIDGRPYEVEGGLGLGLFCWGFAYCPKCGGWWARGLFAATWWKGFWLSSAGVLLEGLRPPAVVMRPEVHDVVVRWRMWGQPFVTWCYPK